MQNNYYTDRFLEDNFEQTVRKKEKLVQEKYTEKQLKELYFDNAQKLNQALIEFKPNRHQKQANKDHKKLMLAYLDECIDYDLSNLSYREKEEFDNKYVSQVASKLTFLGFKMKKFVPFFIGAALIVDILLSLFGIAKHYYYIPIITVFVTYLEFKGLFKAKKRGKLLR
ncbi:hypothetical protein [Psychroflexus sediminis]|uniref:Uncharacterized protein n=1 Tax=Psychroflexus sediminis TaxID=470826 RepID=A0A1G7YZN2_9FLAO|nr:hypothetical protein [Psychroflexus sediminis]SDH01951.1 hypothetical protein SAMN04488027_1166 [Psychroflexus sediminis]